MWSQDQDAFSSFFETTLYTLTEISADLQRVLVIPNWAHEFLQSDCDRSRDFRFVSGVMRYERQRSLDLELHLEIRLASQHERNGLLFRKSIERGNIRVTEVVFCVDINTVRKCSV